MECKWVSECYLDSTDSVFGCRFLLLHLQVMEIVSHTTKLDIRRALTEIPKTLDEAYEATIYRMRRLPTPRANLGIKVLELLLFSRRELSAGELREALAIRHGDRFLNADAIPSDSIILKSCLGLLTPGDWEGSPPKLVHYTLEEYFKRSKEAIFPTAEQEIFNLCITYLSLDKTVLAPIQQELRQLRDEEVEWHEREMSNAGYYNFITFHQQELGERATFSRFLLYAARFWLDHLQMLRHNPEAIARAADLLLSDSANKEYLMASRFLSGDADGYLGYYGSGCRRTPLAIAVAFQLDTLVTELAERRKRTDEHFVSLWPELELAKIWAMKRVDDEGAGASEERRRQELAQRVLRQIEELEIVTTEANCSRVKKSITAEGRTVKKA
jgi:hypothetical protein